MGLAGFRRQTGQHVESLWIRQFHWALAGDVMSEAAGPVITLPTVGALMDLGYAAAWYGAGPI